MNETQGWLGLIEQFLITESVSRAVLIGLLASFAGTQWVKRWVLPVLDLWRRMAPELERLMLVLVAYGIGYSVARSLGGSPLVANLVGIGAPSVYKFAVAALYHYFPWLEKHLSASSRKRIRKADGTEIEVPKDYPTDHGAGDRTIMAPKDRE